MKALEMPEPCLHSEDKDFSRYPLGKTDWAEAQIRASWGVIWASRAPSGFAEVRLAEVLHPQIIQESLNNLLLLANGSIVNKFWTVQLRD